MSKKEEEEKEMKQFFKAKNYLMDTPSKLLKRDHEKKTAKFSTNNHPRQNGYYIPRWLFKPWCLDAMKKELWNFILEERIDNFLIATSRNQVYYYPFKSISVKDHVNTTFGFPPTAPVVGWCRQEHSSTTLFPFSIEVQVMVLTLLNLGMGLELQQGGQT